MSTKTSRPKIRKEVIKMRESLSTVITLLAAKKIPVTMSGTRAYMQSDREGKPLKVVIPHIPDDATDLLLDATRGFIDHEVAHILYTDLKLRATVDRKLEGWWNSVEDIYIERKMTQRLSGSGFNLGRTRRHLINLVFEGSFNRAVASGMAGTELFTKILAVPVLRAVAGQIEFSDWLDDGNKWHYVSEILAAIKRYRIDSMIKACDSTEDCIYTAKVIAKMLLDEKEKEDNPPPPPEEDEEPSPPSDSDPSDEPSDDSPDESSESESDETKEGESSLASDDLDEESADDSAGDGGESPEDEESDGSLKSEIESEDKPESEEEAENESKTENEDESESKTESEEDESSEPEKGKPDPEEDTLEGKGVSDSTPEESDSESDSEMDDDKEPSDEPDSGESSGDDDEAAPFTPDDLDELDLDALEEMGEPLSVEDALESTIRGEAGKSEIPYCILTDEHDWMGKVSEYPKAAASAYMFAERIRGITYRQEELQNTLERNYEVGLLTFSREVEPFIDKGANMAKELERLILGRNKVQWMGAQKSGSVHGGSLFKLKTGETNVFRKKLEHKSKNAAVMIVNDLSGSMNGTRIQMAMASSYVIADAMDKCRIPCMIAGFTTSGNLNAETIISDMRNKTTVSPEMVRELRELQLKRPRNEPLMLPIFKDWDQRTKSDDVIRGLGFGAQGMMLANNPDGECLMRLLPSLLARKEEVKVMIVLSDGDPCASGSFHQQYLLEVTNFIENSTDVMLIGVGIQTNTHRYYKNAVRVDNTSDLPNAICGKIKEALV